MVRALFFLPLQNMQSSEPGHSSVPWSSPGHPELCLARGTCPTSTERCQDCSPLCAHGSCSDGQLAGVRRPGRGKREGLVQCGRRPTGSPVPSRRPRGRSCSPSPPRKVVSVSRRASLCPCARHSRMVVGSGGCPDPELSFPGKAAGDPAWGLQSRGVGLWAAAGSCSRGCLPREGLAPRAWMARLARTPAAQQRGGTECLLRFPEVPRA